ncbi:MAG: uracil-DNA glycosylase [Chloroflexota bacterium]
MERLFALLQGFRGEGVCNQYRDTVPGLDRPDGAAIRYANLRHFLRLFHDAAYVLVGEAAGYAGCRFSGIPFTGEAQLVGVDGLPWAGEAGFAQSSPGRPWRERSGSIVWQALGRRRDCVLWNAFPWHPHGAEYLSNRCPRQAEMRQAREVLAHFLSFYPGAQVFAIGRQSQQALSAIGVKAAYIRHPSHGGKTAFVRGVMALPAR